MGVHADPVVQDEYIAVFDMWTDQADFDNNGFGALLPTKCEITEELSGTFEVTIEHPFDEEGRWKNLLEQNIIRANGELFRIYYKGSKLNSDGSKLRTVRARSIFYDLNDRLLIDVRPDDKSGQEFLDWIMNRVYDDNPSGYYPEYEFTYSSDIQNHGTAYYIGKSVTAALIGEDNCFINRVGGELYRHNFYFSINEHREGSQQDAFDIRYAVDMIDIEETVDYTEVITHIIAKDNFGHEWEVFYEDNPRIAHPVTRYVIFEYEEDSEAAFQTDVNNYFQEHCQPKINYKVNFANLQNVELYKDFIGLQNCNVGDTGTIYCEALGIATQQKIVKKTIDVLNHSTVSIELGNLSSSLTRKDRYSGTIRVGNSATKAAEAAAEEARKAFALSIKNWKDMLNNKYTEVKVLKWGEIYKIQEEE